MKRCSAVLATTLGALAAAAAVVPAHAADVEVDPGTIGISVQITPIECVSGCVSGTEGIGSLAASGVPQTEPILWAAGVLLAVGAALALRATASRRARAASASDSGDGACQS